MSAKNLASTAENGVWRNIQGEWRQLFGSFSREGVSVEYHHFRSEKDLDWSRSFHPGSLEICLNLQGTGYLRADKDELAIGVRSVACYLPAPGGKFQAARTTGEHHHFVTVEMSREFLAARLGKSAAALVAPLRVFLEGGPTDAMPGYAAVEPMNMAVQGIARALAEPPVSASAPAGRVWYEAKILELVSLLLFSPVAAPTEEMFCDRQKRINRERIEQVCSILARDLENPPTLEMLSKEVGCGEFHLSRAFSQHVGQTVPQYLRGLRLERAAQLLKEGRCNVTEAAIAVGYSSLSHFSKAFWETFGCCPGLYGNPKLRAVAQKANKRR